MFIFPKSTPTSNVQIFNISLKSKNRTSIGDYATVLRTLASHGCLSESSSTVCGWGGSITAPLAIIPARTTDRRILLQTQAQFQRSTENLLSRNNDQMKLLSQTLWGKAVGFVYKEHTGVDKTITAHRLDKRPTVLLVRLFFLLFCPTLVIAGLLCKQTYLY